MSQSPAEQLDSRLLSLIQSRVPLVRQPYADLAAQLASRENDILARLWSLRHEQGVIREIAGIFNATALGYRQALVAFRVPAERLDQAGRTVAAHPGVSHCYGRESSYNLWFTLAVSPQSRLGLEGNLSRLADLCGAEARMVLPTLRRYKLDVRFGSEDDGTPQEKAAGNRPQEQATGNRQQAAGETTQEEAAGNRPAAAAEDTPARISDVQVRAIAALQIDLPIQRDPFAGLARQADMDADDLLVHAADFLAAGWMRRYAAVLHHRAAGAAANVMVVWKVDPARTDVAGAMCAQISAVSHCYTRPTSPDWPYGLYTMIHGRSKEDCATTIDEIIAITGLREHAELWTLSEYKKQRVRLFGDQEKTWEESGQ